MTRILAVLAVVVALGAGAIAGGAQRDAAADAAAVPSVIPIFPLPDVVLFPAVSRPLYIFEPRYRQMVADALEGDRIIGMVLLRPGFEKDYEGRPPIYAIGTAGRIADYEELPDGRYGILLRGLTKFRVVGEDQSRPYRLARIEIMPEVTRDADLAPLSALRQRVETLYLMRIPPDASGPDPSLPDESYVNIIAQYLNIPEPVRQELLERSSVLDRAKALVEVLER
jgi:Lon protease-like protein